MKLSNCEEDIKQFSEDIRKKIAAKRMQGKLDFEFTIDQVVADMIVHKMKKEGWKK